MTDNFHATDLSIYTNYIVTIYIQDSLVVNDSPRGKNEEGHIKLLLFISFSGQPPPPPPLQKNRQGGPII